MRSRATRWLSIALAAIVVCVLALGIVEVAVRLLGLAPDVKLIELTGERTVYKRSTNPILGFELKANYRDPEADLVMSYPSTNSHGQRDVERSLAKPAGVTRILVLGASVVEGFGIREIDDTITRRLEKLYGDAPIEVLNFGVSAYCTRAKMELLRVKGLAFSPDIVVLVFTQNDFNNFNHEAFPLGSPVERPEIVERLFTHSALFRVLATRLDLFYYGAQADPVAWNRRAIGDNNVVEGLAMLAELARTHSFSPLIAIWPLFTEREIVDVHPLPGYPEELIIESLARAYGIPTFRFSSFFREDFARRGGEGNPRRLYTLGDAIHPNDVGADLAARALHAALADLVATARSGHPQTPPQATAPLEPAVAEAAKTLGEKDPHYWRITVNLGNTLLSQGRLDEAIEQYERALEMKPDLAEAHSNLGLALKARGDLREATRHYLIALEIDPALPDAHNNLGVILAQQGRFDEAIRHFRRALEERPGFPDALRNLESAQRQRAQQEPR
jgi:tetratricopeptide (TPR) repeat protein